MLDAGNVVANKPEAGMVPALAELMLNKGSPGARKQAH